MLLFIIRQIKKLLKDILCLIPGTTIEDDLNKNDYMVLAGIGIVILLYILFH